MSAVREGRVWSVDVKPGPGPRETLRITYAEGGPDVEAAVIIAEGFTDGGPDFTRPSWLGGPIHFPASAISQVIEALRALEGGR